ncbi:AbrB family transcriptional regulator [Streptomyces meridianus]|uniref:AbrB family transcriptional regulator n=1 Tax=Streptomyces meridianus TaxID=2938945 RepID=A0ABT0X751_9ACTN|nr:AbrB family transcriptional regulator [Streptomyces meridianus]MCM2578347.1 AbrB family transcriptional regulator [Streptomyces meridianus]
MFATSVLPAAPPTFGRMLTTSRTMIGWLFLVAVTYLLGNVARWGGIPAAHLLTALVVGVTAALSGVTRAPFPKRANRAAQAVVGVLMGSYLDPGSMASVADSMLPLAGTILATIGICLGGALLLPRITLMARADAVLGMVPGGSAAIIACAEELDADSRIVAFMQYLRVALVAVTAPLVVMALHSGAAAPAGGPPALLPDSLTVVSSAHPVAGVTVLIALCALGVNAGRSLRLPAPALLGPMLLTGIGVFTGAATGFLPVGPLQDVVFVVVGLEVGLRFTPSSVRHAGRLLPLALVTTFVLCTLCAGLAGVLSVTTGVPFVDAYLATTPGGINAVLATASSLHAHVALISTSQGLRLFAVVLLTPPLIRWAARRGTRIPRRPAGALPAAVRAPEEERQFAS